MVEHLSDLRLFNEIMRTGSISKAGRSMNLSAAVASKRLQRLEDALDTQLVYRTTRSVTPTEAGQELYEKAIGIVEQIDSFIASPLDVAAQGLKGRLRMSSPVWFGNKYVAPCLTEFLKCYPNMQIDLTLDDMRSDMVAEGIDLAITMSPQRPLNFVVRKLLDNRKVLVASPAYVETHGNPKTVKALADHNGLLLGGHRHWVLINRASRKEERITMNSNFSSNNGETTAAAAKAGLGICIKSWWDVADEIAKGMFIHVLPDYELFSDIDISVIYPSKKHLPVKTQIMLKFLMDYIAKLN